MNQYFLAIDIGASSGRHMLAHLEDGRMQLEEMHRFPNGMREVKGELIWDVEALFREIIIGMRKCKEAGKIPVSVGIDTWAVDFVLLDQENMRIGNAVAYRDSRTKGMDELVYSSIPETSLYERTGIQKQSFNTIYQLMALKEKKTEELERADKLLMIPDYLHYLLTGMVRTEYTNATTTQLVSPETKDWDYELIHKLEFKDSLFQKLIKPGTRLGHLTEAVFEQVGFDCIVTVPATHDTASAVAAVPSNQQDILYISSGTWSLMGTEIMKANCSKESREHNLTNEGGYDYRFRYLKNIMGLWMIQSVKKEIGENYSFGEICKAASRSKITSLVDCNEACFLAPENMTEEVRNACRRTGQEVPKNLPEVAAVIYKSLAACYASTIHEIEQMTGASYEAVHIVGGGANAAYLNELTAKATGRNVYAGPTEATAIGNIAVQMIAAEQLENLVAARSCIRKSFPIIIFEP